MTQSWEGKSQGHTSGYRIFVWILRIAGTSPAYFLLRFVAFYYFLFNSSGKHIYRLYRGKLDYSRLPALAKVYRNFYVFGQTLIDKIVVMSGLKVPYTFEFDGENYIRDIIAEGRGGILISAHMGNYELAAYYFKRLPVKVNIVMVENEREQIKEYLESVMGDRNLSIIPIRDDFSHIYDISNALRNNELVAIHADRYVAGSKTITGSFLGQPANFPIGPFILATTFKVPVSYVFCFRENKKHYHLHASPIHEYRDNKQIAIPEALKDYIAELEKKLKRHPEQWFNYFDFWAI